MYSENGPLVDFDDIAKVIAGADVFLLGFAHLEECLLVDARRNDQEVAMLQVVDLAGSPTDQLRSIYRRRPSLGPPLSLTFVGWPHSPHLLVQSGTWGRICDRVGADADTDVRTECDLALRQLRNLDASAMQAVLRGERYHTLWPRRGVPESRT